MDYILVQYQLNVTIVNSDIIENSVGYNYMHH